MKSTLTSRALRRSFSSRRSRALIVRRRVGDCGRRARLTRCGIPLWVQNGSVRARAARPLYPQEQTSSACASMSVWCQQRKPMVLFDHFVGEGEQFVRNGDTERLRRLKVDNQLYFGYLQYREVGRVGTLENLASVNAELALPFRPATTVTD